MLDILLIDDAPHKLDRIRDALSAYKDKVSISDCRNIISAKKVLINRQFDLVVLDIQLPQRDGQMPLRRGGIDLLVDLHSRTCYKKPTCIVGLTEYPDSLSEVEPLFQDKLWSIVLYDGKSDDWADRLLGKVDYLLQTKSCVELDGPFNYDLGIITALPTPEFDAVLRLSTWKDKEIQDDSTRYSETTFESSQKILRVVAACTPQMGMPAAAVLATKLIFHFRPKYLAIIGITAGFPGDTRLGDILVADPCWDWGSGKRRATEGGGYQFDPEPLAERIDPHLRTLFQDVQRDAGLMSSIKTSWPGEKPSTDLRLLIGPCASGASVLADGITMKEIRAHNRKLIGVEMESYGVMHAAAQATQPRPFAFSLKSVCDFGDKTKQDASQTYSAYVTASLLHTIALKYFKPVNILA